jgi:hypothetical protein
MCTNWTLVSDPSEAVLHAEAVVHRAHRRMEQAKWLINDSVLDEVQRLLQGEATGRRSLAWETGGQYLAEWSRTQMAFATPANSILPGLVAEAERMGPKESLPLSSDLSTLKKASPPAEPAADRSRARDAEAKSAMAKRDAEARSAMAKKTPSGSAPAFSGNKPRMPLLSAVRGWRRCPGAMASLRQARAPVGSVPRLGTGLISPWTKFVTNLGLMFQ